MHPLLVCFSPFGMESFGSGHELLCDELTSKMKCVVRTMWHASYQGIVPQLCLHNSKAAEGIVLGKSELLLWLCMPAAHVKPFSLHLDAAMLFRHKHASIPSSSSELRTVHTLAGS